LRLNVRKESKSPGKRPRWGGEGGEPEVTTGGEEKPVGALALKGKGDANMLVSLICRRRGRLSQGKKTARATAWV